MIDLPPKTVERISQYRRVLLQYLGDGKTHIFSHELANLIHITSVQVRRDIMLIGYAGSLRKGYDVQELIDRIGDLIDSAGGLKVALIGVGQLGKSVASYFSGKRSKLNIVATFDVDEKKIGKKIVGVPCYSMSDLETVIGEEGISIGVITSPPESTIEVSKKLVESGIKGILNYTPTCLSVPNGVYLEEYDMITSLEKVAFFIKQNEK